MESDWFSALSGQNQRFSLIVSNPPYVASADMEALMREVKDFEPALALDGGQDGLDPYRLLAEEAPGFLETGGLLAVEVGVFQSNDVSDMFKAVGLVDVTVHKDLPGQERVISGRKR
jgi:release factor glutamine methyltransferase